MNEKEAVTPVLSLCNSPFLYFSSLSSSSYCITGALQGFLQPSYRWQAASSAHLLLRPSLLLLLLLLRRQLFFLFSALASSLVAAFNSAFLAFSCVFRSSRFAVNVATSDSIFSFFFCGLFCNDCYIINAGLYSTSLILASLGSCHNNFLP